MDNNNFIVAVVLSIAILIGFHYVYEKPKMEQARQQQVMNKLAETAKPEAKVVPVVALRDRAQILNESSRVEIKTPELHGSINLKSGRIDDLSLVNYNESTDKNSPQIVLLSPAGSSSPHQAYYAEFGWLGKDIAVPDANTLWKANNKILTPSKPVRLTWDNGNGLVFERTIAVDDKYMFTIKDHVKNENATTATLYPYGLISRHGKPHISDTYVLHEGPIGVLGGTVIDKEVKYKNLEAESKKIFESLGGWLGITDKYWLVALVPAADEKIVATFTYDKGAETNPDQGVFQSDFMGSQISLGQGADTERTVHFFAGAKRVRVLDEYEKKYGIDHFDRAIDFGWYYFLTKPFLYLLDYLGQWFGNYGWAIIIFTIFLKILTLPLSLKSYRSMAKMKTLQPEMKLLQEKYKEDKQRLSVETMELYKREKVNPMSGCLPNIIQIPIFFALYKVLYVGIELRQAPLFGWIKDLSDYDPTSVLTLFGTLDWSFMPHLGVWPLLMGLSMFLQQRLSPQPPDKTQAQVFQFLPLIFTFMMAKVAVGLIFYWTISNLIGIVQQWFIMHKTGGRKA